MIEAEGVCKAFGRRQRPAPVLEDVSFRIEDGEFVGILGPSGCGKTTLLRIIAGLIPMDRGSISIDGLRLAGCGPDRRMVFQDFALLPWRTVLGNVEFGLDVMGMAKMERRERARSVIERTGLGGFEHFYPYELSGGMQQRVGLARAFAVNPATLLMDEPFGALDAQTRRTLQEDLLTLVEHSQSTVILVTHDMEEAVLLCDRILVMHSQPGRIVKIVETTGLLPRPRGGRVDDVRATAGFEELVAELWTVLRASKGTEARRQHAAG